VLATRNHMKRLTVAVQSEARTKVSQGVEVVVEKDSRPVAVIKAPVIPAWIGWPRWPQGQR
jgi:hypothetical protein